MYASLSAYENEHDGQRYGEPSSHPSFALRTAHRGGRSSTSIRCRGNPNEPFGNTDGAAFAWRTTLVSDLCE